MNALITLAATAVTFLIVGAWLGAMYGTRSAGSLMDSQHERSQNLMVENRKLRQQLGHNQEDAL